MLNECPVRPSPTSSIITMLTLVLTLAVPPATIALLEAPRNKLARSMTSKRLMPVSLLDPVPLAMQDVVVVQEDKVVVVTVEVTVQGKVVVMVMVAVVAERADQVLQLLPQLRLQKDVRLISTEEP